MSDNGWTWTLDRRIPSDTSLGSEIIDEVMQALARHEWGPHDAFGIHLSLEEAIVNAIKHGNRFDEEKEVHVQIKLSPERLLMRVEDQGDGFNPDDVPDPTEDGRLDQPCGRGVMLMRHYMSDVQFSKRGNLVEMTKTRQGELN